MRRPPLAASALAALVLLGALALALLRPAAAQETTPEPGAVTSERLGGGVAATVPAAPAVFELNRLVFAPGAGFALTAAGQGLVMLYVESGAITLRAGADPVALEAGASAVIPPGTAAEFRNEGTGPAVVLSPVLYPAPPPAATPAP
jgi:quercetin dioxygenase-like cupin family protein